MPESLYQTELLDKKNLTSDVWELTFARPNGFEFEAGQFARFKIPNHEAELFRSYSISSSPLHDHLQFCIKLVDGGRGSSYLSSLKKGDQVALNGPRGRFTCGSLSKNNHFIATGAGIAPIIAMLETSVPKHPDKKFDLLFGVREEKDVFWTDRFDALTKNANFSYQLTFSRPAEAWSGLKGRVTDHLVPDPEGEYYLCGSMDMIKDARAKLLLGQVNTKCIHLEIF